MSGSAIRSAAFSASTDPPYWTRTVAAASGPASSPHEAAG